MSIKEKLYSSSFGLETGLNYCNNFSYRSLKDICSGLTFEYS